MCSQGRLSSVVWLEGLEKGVKELASQQMLVAEDADRKEVSSQQKVFLPDVCPQCSRAICSCLAVGKDPLSVCCVFSLYLSVCVYVCIFVSDSLSPARALSPALLSLTACVTPACATYSLCSTSSILFISITHAALEKNTKIVPDVLTSLPFAPIQVF